MMMETTYFIGINNYTLDYNIEISNLRTSWQKQTPTYIYYGDKECMLHMQLNSYILPLTISGSYIEEEPPCMHVYYGFRVSLGVLIQGLPSNAHLRKCGTYRLEKTTSMALVLLLRIWSTILKNRSSVKSSTLT